MSREAGHGWLVLGALVTSHTLLAVALASAVSPAPALEVIDISVTTLAVSPGEPVTVFVQLPAGAKLVRASPVPTAQVGDWLRMDVDLAGDVTFVVDFRMG